MSNLKLGNIQGNILGGFNKDFQNFLFLKFKSTEKGRAWISEITDSDMGVANSSSKEVLKFNAQFKALKARGITKPETIIRSAWTNLAISWAGLKALGVPDRTLNKFPADFIEGMAARKTLVGDLGKSDPSRWTAPFGPGDIHAILSVAADDLNDLNNRIAVIKVKQEFINGVVVLHEQEGRVRSDEPGHEHFGFLDGVSQPGIRGITRPDDPLSNPNQGHPGQDLLWPGEFVLGYPTQIPTAKNGVDGLNPDPGPTSVSGPRWTRDGSYLVFRRLAQDVPAFRKQVKALANASGLMEDLMGAKLVGRYKSGCPIEKRAFQPEPFTPANIDPGIANPALAKSDTLNNNFEFGEDEDGKICPLSAHIRKAYPRDEQIIGVPHEADSESETQTHRLLRRGIPFGASFDQPSDKGGGAGEARGLLFVCYQKSIEQQFELVQSQWVNDTNFPPFPTGVTPGEDPIIAQSLSGTFQLDPTKPNIGVDHFVTTTGGEYFFAPSIAALRKLGNGTI